VETVPQEDALAVTAEPAGTCKTLQAGAADMVGTKDVVDALFPTSLEETPTPSTTTATHQPMLDSGKSTLSTGHLVQVEVLHATLMSTSNALSRYTTGEETHGNSGQLMLAADADLQPNLNSNTLTYFLCYLFLIS